eukprot:Clim_evm35s108 gene=Clim_evmTU35s108
MTDEDDFTLNIGGSESRTSNKKQKRKTDGSAFDLINPFAGKQTHGNPTKRASNGTVRNGISKNSSSQRNGRRDQSASEQKGTKRPLSSLAEVDVETPVSHREVKKSKGIVSSVFTKNPEIVMPEAVEADTSMTTKAFGSGGTGDVTTFTELPLSNRVQGVLQKKFAAKYLTVVQRKALPHLLRPIPEGERALETDFIIKSPTGSGKTLVYLLPILEHLRAITPPIKRITGLHALILAPTRELALQIYETSMSLCTAEVRIVPGCLTGGENRKSEKARLRKGVNILIATPGRLLDHMKNTESLLLDRTRFFVLDEADRLCDMGFAPVIEEIVQKLPSDRSSRTNLLLSATLPSKVLELASLGLRHNVTRIDAALKEPHNGTEHTAAALEAESDDGNIQVPSSLCQSFSVVPAKLKLTSLIAFLAHEVKKAQQHPGSPCKAVVFVSTCEMVDFFTALLQYPDGFAKQFNEASLTQYAVEGFDLNQQRNILELALSSIKKPATRAKTSKQSRAPVLDEVAVYGLHGSMPQKKRTQVYKGLRSKDNRSVILFCTDVAARGLDIQGVTWVIQYGIPDSIESYVHRVGRSGRLDAKGASLIMLLPSETDYITSLRDKKIFPQPLEVSTPGMQKGSAEGVLADAFGHAQFNRMANDLQIACEELVQSNDEVSDLCDKAFVSFIRSYGAYPRQMKAICHIKKLHLGHVAKAFALRRSPKQVLQEMKGVKLNGAMRKGGSGKKQFSRPNKYDANAKDMSTTKEYEED